MDPGGGAKLFLGDTVLTKDASGAVTGVRTYAQDGASPVERTTTTGVTGSSLVWLFSDRMAIAFNGFFEAFLGFLLLPFTTLFFALVCAPIGGVSGFGWLIVAFGLALDISSYTSGAKAKRDQAANA